MHHGHNTKILEKAENHNDLEIIKAGIVMNELENHIKTLQKFQNHFKYNPHHDTFLNITVFGCEDLTPYQYVIILEDTVKALISLFVTISDPNDPVYLSLYKKMLKKHCDILKTCYGVICKK